MIPPITRSCTHCKRELPLENFSNDRTRTDGLSKWCKQCVAENSREHYRKNREEALVRQAERRAAEPERVRAIGRASDLKHRDRKRAYNRDRYLAKREEILAHSKAAHRFKRYGVTAEQFATLLAEQGGGCAICGVEEARWHIDHDHSCCPTIYTCGKCLRGILCRACNIGLGNFRDDPDLLERAVSYLREQ